MAIDRIDWHWDSVTDATSDDEHWEKAGAHIGYYIEWAFRKGFANPEIHGSTDEVEDILDSGVNGVQFLIDYCDTKFWNDDLNEEGKNFTSFAYEKYVQNFEKIVGHKLYEKKYNQQDLQAVSNYLDKVYEAYLNNPPVLQIQVQKDDGNYTTINVEKKESKNKDTSKLVAIIISIIVIVTFFGVLVYGAIISLGDKENEKEKYQKIPEVDSPKVNIVKLK